MSGHSKQGEPDPRYGDYGREYTQQRGWLDNEYRQARLDYIEQAGPRGLELSAGDNMRTQNLVLGDIAEYPQTHVGTPWLVAESVLRAYRAERGDGFNTGVTVMHLAGLLPDPEQCGERANNIHQAHWKKHYPERGSFPYQVTPEHGASFVSNFAIAGPFLGEKPVNRGVRGWLILMHVKLSMIF